MRIDKESDLWETPQGLFHQLNEEFDFGVDLCASGSNTKCPRYFKGYLSNELDTGFKCNFLVFCLNHAVSSAFMNPPYSNPLPFIKKADKDSKFCKIVMLIKCDTSTKTWGVFWDYDLNKPKLGCEVRFLPKRLKFERDGISSKNCANFPSAIIIMDRRSLE